MRQFREKGIAPIAILNDVDAASRWSESVDCL